MHCNACISLTLHGTQGNPKEFNVTGLGQATIPLLLQGTSAFCQAHAIHFQGLEPVADYFI